MRRWFPTLLLFVPAVATAAGWTVTGTVRDTVSGQALPRASVRVVETGQSGETADDGTFALETGADGWLTLAVSRPGYEVVRLSVESGGGPLVVVLAPMVSFADRIEVTATRAREGTDPASFSNLPRERVEEAYWGQDPALLLAETVPGFFAYNDNGNGIGYSYFTVRGFGQASRSTGAQRCRVGDCFSSTRGLPPLPATSSSVVACTGCRDRRRPRRRPRLRR